MATEASPTTPADPRVTLSPAGPHGFVAEPAMALFTGWPGHEFLFGGIALGGCIAAMELATGAPVSFAAAQFIAFARPGETLRFEVDLLSHGNRLSQCMVTCHAADRRFLVAQGTVGTARAVVDWQGEAAPGVAPPEDCPPISVARLLSSNINGLFEVRLAAGSLPDRADWSGPGRESLCLWARTRSGAPVDPPTLAVLADFLAIALPGALGRPASGTSLDNHIRFTGASAGDEWVLCAFDIEAIRGGIAHGRVRQYARGGELLALASQSMILRLREAG